MTVTTWTKSLEKEESPSEFKNQGLDGFWIMSKDIFKETRKDELKLMPVQIARQLKSARSHKSGYSNLRGRKQLIKGSDLDARTICRAQAAVLSVLRGERAFPLVALSTTRATVHSAAHGTLTAAAVGGVACAPSPYSHSTPTSPAAHPVVLELLGCLPNAEIPKLAPRPCFRGSSKGVSLPSAS
ncbi:hypothetical protein mRhiFer1_009609 [Rhinolophus ferrumequinum]|uniref:Uncharacterized protein n=1 Tax=Rhinolophus ferrumequinum TaxID=59479 RepID=A0A7J7ZQL9_RHIFE|nr:hypothetical protein mRhiFer1_009609 [Rhinolophus ferrumequinum]